MSIEEKQRRKYADASAYLRRQLTRTYAVLRDKSVKDISIPNDWNIEDMEEAVEIAISLFSALNISYVHYEMAQESYTKRIEEILGDVYNETT